MKGNPAFATQVSVSRLPARIRRTKPISVALLHCRAGMTTGLRERRTPGDRPEIGSTAFGSVTDRPLYGTVVTPKQCFCVPNPFHRSIVMRYRFISVIGTAKHGFRRRVEMRRRALGIDDRRPQRAIPELQRSKKQQPRDHEKRYHGTANTHRRTSGKGCSLHAHRVD